MFIRAVGGKFLSNGQLYKDESLILHAQAEGHDHYYAP